MAKRSEIHAPHARYYHLKNGIAVDATEFANWIRDASKLPGEPSFWRQRGLDIGELPRGESIRGIRRANEKARRLRRQYKSEKTS